MPGTTPAPEPVATEVRADNGGEAEVGVALFEIRVRIVHGCRSGPNPCCKQKPTTEVVADKGTQTKIQLNSTQLNPTQPNPNPRVVRVVRGLRKASRRRLSWRERTPKPRTATGVCVCACVRACVCVCARARACARVRPVVVNCDRC